MAKLAGPNVKVRWAAEKVKGTYKKLMCRYEREDHPTKGNEHINVLKREWVDEERGWMVYFPAGHSLHIATEEEMKRLGFMDNSGRLLHAGLVDMTTGLPVESDADPLAEMKRTVARHTRDDFSAHFEG